MKELLTIIILFILICIFNINNKKNNNTNSSINTDKKINTVEKEEIQPYKLNNNIFTENERFFYKILKEITNPLNLIIMTKVRLADIIYTEEYNYKYFNKIKSKHIDFVLIDNDGKIKLLIELDDKSHQDYERQERDKFINKIFENLNIKLLRIEAKKIYNIEELKNKIKESL